MKYFFAILIMGFTTIGFSQSGITITPKNTYLPMAEEKGEDLLQHFEIKISDVSNAAKVHVQLSSEENSGVFRTQIYTVLKADEIYTLSNGQEIIDNALKIPFLIRSVEKKYYRFCTIYVEDKNGMMSNKLVFPN